MRDRRATDDHGLVNLHWAFALIDGLAAAGLRHAVLSPGSRSTPLALACRQHPRIRVWVHPDERSAGFFGLGLARTQGCPAALVCTSGSAPAHWFPAVIEASQGQVPLILLSADRPPELHGWGANQTIDQAYLFGDRVRAFHCPGPPGPTLAPIRALGVKAVEQTLWPEPGPVHINVPFREPLVPAAPVAHWPDTAGPAAAIAAPRCLPDPAVLAAACAQMNGRPGVIVCGGGRFPPAFPRELLRLGEASDAPILADPLSGLRFGLPMSDRLSTRYDAFLRHPGFASRQRPEWVLRFGRPPVSRVLLDYLAAQPDADHILVAASGWPDPLHRTGLLVRADPLAVCQAMNAHPWARTGGRDWSRTFRLAERAARPPPPADSGEQPYEGAVIHELLRLLPAGSLLFSANSLPVRQLDTWSGTRPKALTILCNRGSSGIDGSVSTLLGLAAGASVPVVGLLGDLSFFHDMNGLLLSPGIDTVILVFNNGGGAIFGYLPQAALPDFENLWLTPPGLDLEQAARLYRLDFHRVRQQSQFSSTLQQALATPGTSLVEVTIDRDLSQRRHQAYWQWVAARL